MERGRRKTKNILPNLFGIYLFSAFPFLFSLLNRVEAFSKYTFNIGH